MEYVYAALLLHKLEKEVSEENVKSVVVAAGGEVDESKIKSLTASLKGVDIAKELESASLVAAAPAAGLPGGGRPALWTGPHATGCGPDRPDALQRRLSGRDRARRSAQRAGATG